MWLQSTADAAVFETGDKGLVKLVVDADNCIMSFGAWFLEDTVTITVVALSITEQAFRSILKADAMYSNDIVGCLDTIVWTALAPT